MRKSAGETNGERPGPKGPAGVDPGRAAAAVAVVAASARFVVVIAGLVAGRALPRLRGDWRLINP